MIEMGVDATDPIEPPPAGDLAFAEARAIVGDKWTLMGNLEWDEMESQSPDYIRRRAREMLDCGPRRLVLCASGGPISAVSEQLVENYQAWVDEAMRN